PPVIKMSWMRAMITGIAYFGSKRIAMYAEITRREKTMAITALLATWAPKVGPTVVPLKPFSPPFRPKLLSSVSLTVVLTWLTGILPWISMTLSPSLG